MCVHDEIEWEFLRIRSYWNEWDELECTFVFFYVEYGLRMLTRNGIGIGIGFHSASFWSRDAKSGLSSSTTREHCINKEFIHQTTVIPSARLMWSLVKRIRMLNWTLETTNWWIRLFGSTARKNLLWSY